MRLGPDVPPVGGAGRTRPPPAGGGARVLVAGTYDRGDAYPNVVGRIRALQRDARLDVLEAHVPATTRVDHGSSLRRLLSSARNASRLASACARAVLHVVHHRDRQTLYVPYPSLFVLCALSLLPRRARPERIVADAFISVHDTVVHDRRLLSPEGVAARALWRLERRAFAEADAVAVDTPQNADHYRRTFALPPGRFVPLPLATPYGDVRSVPYEPDPGRRFQLVFVGTMVPLHGVDVLCEAVRLLAPDLPIDVRLYGDGQCASSVRALIEPDDGGEGTGEGVRVFWHRDWLDASGIARAVSEADLCIGVLGTTAKSDRVWPFKNYLYAACGRALVNARTSAALSMERLDRRRWFLSVPPGDASALAALVEGVVRDRRPLQTVAAAGRQVFERRLSGPAVDDAVLEALLGRPAGKGTG